MAGYLASLLARATPPGLAPRVLAADVLAATALDEPAVDPPADPPPADAPPTEASSTSPRSTGHEAPRTEQRPAVAAPPVAPRPDVARPEQTRDQPAPIAARVEAPPEARREPAETIVEEARSVEPRPPDVEREIVVSETIVEEARTVEPAAVAQPDPIRHDVVEPLARAVVEPLPTAEAVDAPDRRDPAPVEATAPTVSVRIGRIVVQPPPARGPSAPVRRPRSPHRTLDDYLSERGA